MNLFRLQNNVPPIYVNESRDFQLLCRLYDSVDAGFKYDIDQITGILNPLVCRENLLPLLETKAGFFTDKMVNDVAVRYILAAFPDILKYKGSLKGVQYAINAFLKIYDIRTNIIIYTMDMESPEVLISVDYYTIVIAVNKTIKDIKILQELLKYVLPPGFRLQIYLYKDIENMIEIVQNEKVKLIFVSDNINSMIRQEHVSNVSSELDHLVGAVDTVNIASTDSEIMEN